MISEFYPLINQCCSNLNWLEFIELLDEAHHIWKREELMARAKTLPSWTCKHLLFHWNIILFFYDAGLILRPRQVYGNTACVAEDTG